VKVVTINVVCLVCVFGLCHFRIEMETKHCNISAIPNDTQDYIFFQCMLHTLAQASRQTA
jgi:hypothetical protein